MHVFAYKATVWTVCGSVRREEEEEGDAISD